MFRVMLPRVIPGVSGCAAELTVWRCAPGHSGFRCLQVYLGAPGGTDVQVPPRTPNDHDWRVVARFAPQEPAVRDHANGLATLPGHPKRHALRTHPVGGLYHGEFQ